MELIEYYEHRNDCTFHYIGVIIEKAYDQYIVEVQETLFPDYVTEPGSLYILTNDHIPNIIS